MHVESHRGDETRQVLMDFGFTPDALPSNSLIKARALFAFVEGATN